MVITKFYINLKTVVQLMMYVQIIDHCDPDDKENRESFWIETFKQCIHVD